MPDGFSENDQVPLVGGVVLAILKNDGLRQWEGLYIPYMKWWF